jgi:hypothetical protein
MPFPLGSIPTTITAPNQGIVGRTPISRLPKDNLLQLDN